MEMLGRRFPILRLLDLALHVNDPRNIFSIPKDDNQSKRRIGIDDYMADSDLPGTKTISNYLHSYFTPSGAMV